MVLEETLERGWAWEVLESGPGAPPGTISGQRNRRCTAIWGGPLRISASIPEPLGSPLQSQLQEPDSPTGSLGCFPHRAAPAAGGGALQGSISYDGFTVVALQGIAGSSCDGSDSHRPAQ